jgi:gp017|nr:MAG TPA: hypothetical protein [Caudoviricetes sp.]
MSDYLSHHGVKGMKWGVRKDKDKAHRQSAISGYTEVAQKIRTSEKTVDTKSSKDVNVFLAVQFMKNHFDDAFLREVKSRGYNALQDFNDAGGVSKSPIISLDPDGSVREVGRRALSAWDINESQKNLKAFR